MFGLEKLFGSSDEKKKEAPQMGGSIGGEETSMGGTEEATGDEKTGL